MAFSNTLLYAVMGIMAITLVSADPKDTGPKGMPGNPGMPGMPGSMTGDPHLVGFNGRKFDFHGLHQHTYAILSDAGHQMNAIMADDVNEVGTNMETIAFKHGADHVQVDYVKANNSQDGQGLAVLANGKLLAAGEKVTLPEGTVVTASKEMDIAGKVAWNTVTIRTSTYAVTIVNPADLPSNRWETRLDIQSVQILRAPSGSVHGVLGVTYEQTVGAVGGEEAAPYPGEDADYEVSSIFEHDFTFASYTGKTGPHGAGPNVSLTRATRMLLTHAGIASFISA